MTTIKYAVPAAIETILTTELNALANGARVISGALSNDDAAELYLYADFELYVGATSAKTAPHVQLYILEEIDGTNYTYGGTALTPPATALAGIFLFDTGGTAAGFAHLRKIELPPYNFKVVVYNLLGVAFTATTNTLKYRRYSLQSA